MLPHIFQEDKKKYITYPAIIQPKFDGYRAIYDSGKLTSLQDKTLLCENSKIVKGLKDVFASQFIIDGELCVNDMNTVAPYYLNNTSVAKYINSPGADQIIKYYMFDIVNFTETFGERFITLYNLYERNKAQLNQHNIYLVKSFNIQDEAGLDLNYLQFLQSGGLLVRNFNAKIAFNDNRYKKTLTNDVQKYVRFTEGTFVIVGFKETKVKSVIWICKTEEGETFAVKPATPEADAVQAAKTACNYIGYNYKVKYQGLTDKGIPKHPVGLGFNDERVKAVLGGSLVDTVAAAAEVPAAEPAPVVTTVKPANMFGGKAKLSHFNKRLYSKRSATEAKRALAAVESKVQKSERSIRKLQENITRYNNLIKQEKERKNELLRKYRLSQRRHHLFKLYEKSRKL